MGMGTYIQTAWKYVHTWMILISSFLIFKLSFDVLCSTNHKWSSAGPLSGWTEDIFLLIQHRCNRLISNYSFFTWIYLFKLTFYHEHSTVLAVFSCSCREQTHTHGTSLQPTPWSAYSYGGKKKGYSMQLKGLGWPRPCFLLMPFQCYFLDPLVTEGVAYRRGIKEGSNTHAD